MIDLEQTRQKFSRDRFATEGAGITIEAVDTNYAKCRLAIGPQHCNALGNPMGGAIFTLADFAFAVASNQQGQSAVSLASSITFLTASRGKVLFAEAHMIRSGRTTCFYQVDVTDDRGARIAYVTINGAIVGQ